MLVLVLEHEVPHPVGGLAGRGHLKGALPHRGEVLERFGPAQVGEVAPLRARGLESVIEIGQVRPQEVEAAGPVAHPHVLIGGDVAQVPHQRAHERIVHAIQVLVRHRLDQSEGALASFREKHFDPSTGRCLNIWRTHGTGLDRPADYPGRPSPRA